MNSILQFALEDRYNALEDLCKMQVKINTLVAYLEEINREVSSTNFLTYNKKI